MNLLFIDVAWREWPSGLRRDQIRTRRVSTTTELGNRLGLRTKPWPKVPGDLWVENT